MHTHGITSQLPAKLTDGLHEWRALDVANRATHLGNDEVKILFTFTQHPTFNLVCDMWHHLNRLTQIVSATLAVDDGFVDTPRSDRVVACGVNAGKPLIVAQIQVSFHTVNRHVAFAVLIRVQRPRVDVDIGVELLDGNLVTPRLKQLAYRGRDNALTQRGNHTTRNEDILCAHILLF